MNNNGLRTIWEFLCILTSSSSIKKSAPQLPTQLKQIVAHDERERSRTRNDHIRPPIAFPLLYSAQMLRVEWKWGKVVLLGGYYWVVRPTDRQTDLTYRENVLAPSAVV